MKNHGGSILVAIVGGSGAGKTWLAKQLHELLGRRATRVSLDDFYRDRSHVTAAARARINFDHPRAIDWPAVESALCELKHGRPARIPCYDFTTHCRGGESISVPPTPIVLVDGLWLLRRPTLRRLFDLRIYVDCPARTRLARRLDRDLRSRGRTITSVRKQFHETVEPMHRRYVEPQSRQADVVLRGTVRKRDLESVLRTIRALLSQAKRGDE